MDYSATFAQRAQPRMHSVVSKYGEEKWDKAKEYPIGPRSGQPIGCQCKYTASTQELTYTASLP